MATQSISAEFGIASVSFSNSQSHNERNDSFTPISTRPLYTRSQSLTVPSAILRPRSASDFITQKNQNNQSNIQSTSQSANQSNNNQFRKPNLRSQSLSSLKFGESSLASDSSFQRVSEHINNNYWALRKAKRRFLICCAILLGIIFLSLLYTIYQYVWFDTLNHWSFASFGLSLLWLLCCQASGLFNQRVNAPSLYVSYINRWFRLYGIEFDRKVRTLKVMSVKAIQIQARKEKMKKLHHTHTNNQSINQSVNQSNNQTNNSISPLLPLVSSLHRASSEAMRQRVIAELEDEEVAAGTEGQMDILTTSDYPIIRPSHKHKGED